MGIDNKNKILQSVGARQVMGDCGR